MKKASGNQDISEVEIEELSLPPNYRYSKTCNKILIPKDLLFMTASSTIPPFSSYYFYSLHPLTK